MYKHEDAIQKREKLISNIIKESFEIEKENLSKKEIQTEVIYNCFMHCLNSEGNAEIKDIAATVSDVLEKLEMDNPISDTYIKSLFNFNSIYVPLYDLLDLAIDYSIAGKKMSEDYRNGVIDSIVTLRRFQRYSGFGDHEWIKDWNYAIDKPSE